MEMDKKERRPGTSGKSLSDALGATPQADSRPAGDGSTTAWTNERGETCIGNKCFSLAFREGEDDVTVRIDRNECGEDMQPIVENILSAIGKGGRTIYETKSLIRKPPAK